MRKHRLPSINCDAPLDPLVRLWMLRILIPLGALKPLLRLSCGDSLIFAALGAEDGALDEASDSQCYARLQPKLKRLWQAAEAGATRASLSVPIVLRANLERLGVSLGLNDTERQLLAWACLVAEYPLLGEVAGALDGLSNATAARALARILDLPAKAVQAALGRSGILHRSGLLRVEQQNGLSLNDKLVLIGDDFVNAIQRPNVDPLDLLRGAIRRSKAAELKLDNYPHLASDLAILVPYLGDALARHGVGVNVLFYGPPGTGKTELVRALAQRFCSELFEIVSEDEDGEPINAEGRLQAYAAAQRLLAQSRSMVLFDECSDAFAEAGPSGWFTMRRRASRSGKGWFNHTLESNPAPTFWLTNDPSGMDSALLRRFDVVVEMPVPPRAVRRAIAQAHCGGLVGEATLDTLAASETLAPAVLTRAAAVAGAVAKCEGAPEPDAALLLLVNQNLRVQGQAEVRAKDPARLPEIYDPALVHADTDLEALAEGILRAGSARLCLYGPPGTGKSAYARWLAQQLGRPLHLRRASDLISKWLGDSEKNIARAFREAERDHAVLVLDEVDSFLQERRDAAQSWEVTQVNEMLTQMEAFAGVFVATTNLIDGLDAASLRRFDLKAKFDYLRPEQAVELLRRHCQALALDKPGKAQAVRVGRIRQLTPGDFAAVVRRHAFRPLASCAELVDALCAECALKSGAKAAIGFVAG